jgi:hypothetical protein
MYCIERSAMLLLTLSVIIGDRRLPTVQATRDFHRLTYVYPYQLQKPIASGKGGGGEREGGSEPERRGEESLSFAVVGSDSTIAPLVPSAVGPGGTGAMAASSSSSSGEQQYSLRWNDFHSSILSSFRHLRDEEDFVDVTLACDSSSFTAHKVVLSACSPYFRRLLKVSAPPSDWFSWRHDGVNGVGRVGGERIAASQHLRHRCRQSHPRIRRLVFYRFLL